MGAPGTRAIFQSWEGAERWGAIILEFREILEEGLPQASVAARWWVTTRHSPHSAVGDIRKDKVKGPMGWRSRSTLPPDPPAFSDQEAAMTRLWATSQPYWKAKPILVFSSWVNGSWMLPQMTH